MHLNRRQFLILSSLGVASSVFLAKLLSNESAQSTDIQPIVAASAQTQPLLRFISVADTGTGAQGQYAVAGAMTQYHSQNPFNLAILAGDNIYTNG
ncbi:MAG TPA: metallophosphoesterase, partial [Cyanobacteria bacterium UBA11369]|nr:metallophosphoesterase [Cyanobacteria bacterium UBA11369]